MRALVLALALVASGSAHATECRFPGVAPISVDLTARVLKVKGETFALIPYGEESTGGPGYRDGDTWGVDGAENANLLPDRDGLVYVRVHGKHSLFIVDDRTHPSLKGECKG